MSPRHQYEQVVDQVSKLAAPLKRRKVLILVGAGIAISTLLLLAVGHIPNATERLVAYHQAATSTDEYIKCLIQPPTNEVMYGVEKCISNLNNQRYLSAIRTIETLPKEQLPQYQGMDTYAAVPKWRIFDLFQPTYECNAMDLIRIGAPSKVLDTGKWICTDKLDFGSGAEKKCTIFSLGSNNQFDFEHDIHVLFPQCQIHTFDCTGDWSNPATTFHKTCIGGKDEVDSQGRTFKRLATIRKELGVDTISVLKMDIEHYEWPFFLDLLNESVEDRPMQILVEFHAGMWQRGADAPWALAPSLFENWSNNWAVPMARVVKLFDELGYRIVFQVREDVY
ncbi:hypothetical protein PhCBS80983_g01955 [Powellomyces hirtus]|uniref:Methyltransferase domain-containing protein n=1 Tax=Powellomyces hirtus TaxID=109895 RepID=A0A507E7Z8_9FUNG|nr:methyltransferase domain-containing protein [Powellomyces hirtus]TPX60193.1 hypothetical protein PhCBS80983_g01955 [Powellomyces hirtus]